MTEPLYIADKEVARLLDRSVAWFKSNAKALESQYGFPKIDPAIGKRHRETVEKWARERNQRSEQQVREARNRGNLDAI